MSIQYSLVPNHLTSDPDDFRALVEGQVSRTSGDIIETMVQRGSTITKPDILSVIESYQAVIADFLSDGDSINTPLFQTSASISGVFASQYADFNPSVHEVNINLNLGSRIAELAEELTVKRVSASVVRPAVRYFKDFSSGAVNQTLTPGNPAEIRGGNLKVDPADTSQGIFFIAADGTETKVTTIMRNMPSNLIFMVPGGLAAGEYEVEVRMKPKDNDTDIRSGRLNDKLTVS